MVKPRRDISMRNIFRRESIVDPRNNIVAILLDARGHVKQRRTFYGKNLVTNTGDQWYAEAAVAAGSVITPAGMTLGSSAVAPAKSDISVGSVITSGSADIDSGYPRTDDNDADNTGAGADIGAGQVRSAAGLRGCGRAWRKCPG